MPQDTPRTSLELREVSKQFGKLAALRSVSLQLRTGDAVLLYGPNGAGKSTLLRVLSTLVRPGEGAVLYNGEDAHVHPGPAKAAIGFVAHATFLYGELTTRENLEFAGKLFGLTDVAREIGRVVDTFQLGERVRTPVRELSRGYQQRVALARAFLHDPEFVLLDEPFTGLDAASVESLTELMRGLPAAGKGLIFSTHDFEQGRSLAQRLVSLEAGWLRYDGPFGSAPLRALHIESGR